ncbi:hypothetical protein SAMN02745945_01446 [Peptoclostridium litorale DSM 5388]|uniref:Uncharacterized protein n=1 Tax=Peptoclostridium litorale DSM 5388 TaxID=1121324 RepID=A0A069RF20_PEPLI|nr:hypothetical protein [Peptoclostridium litorale]KDR95596.1 hypothetical protein CLIT_10c03230 [Peptoclostridium litorale DSM 5388]SIN99060.1 hypothetical protein SAMN02745945_01446 [Peptoclostridium litorale DSM 5388]
MISKGKKIAASILSLSLICSVASGYASFATEAQTVQSDSGQAASDTQYIAPMPVTAFVFLDAPYKNLESVIGEGQKSYTKSNTGEKLSSIDYSQNWFGIEKKLNTSYIVEGENVSGIKVDMPLELTNEDILSSITKELGAPLQSNVSDYKASEIKASWLKYGVLYSLDAYSDSKTLSISLAKVENPSKYGLSQNSTVMSKKTADVTGDGKADTVTLMGQNFQDDFGKSIFMEHVVAVVEDSSTGKEIIVKPSESSDGGYQPDMELLDFDGDNTSDIFISAATGGSGGYTNYNLVTIKDSKPIILVSYDIYSGYNMELDFEGSFKDGYKASVTVSQTGKTYDIDLSERKDVYEGYEYKDNKLQREVPIMQGALYLEPVDTDSDGTYEFAAQQSIKGTCNADTIALVKSTWSVKGGDLKLITSDVEDLK